MKRWIEIGLLTVWGFILVFPAVQRHTHPMDSKPLKGWHAPSHHPQITSNSWFSGSYQKAFDAYSADSFGMTNTLVRWHNQLDFNLFHTPNARYVVLGKENYLYETAYIESALGMNFPGDTLIVRKCHELKRVSNWLGNTRLMVVLAPGKGSYFPEFFPDYYGQYQSDSTLYDRYRHHLQENGIKTLDFHAWFRQMKDTSRYPLFPKTGIHWSDYGQLVAADSLQRFLGNWFNRSVPRYSWSLGNPTKESRGSDADVEDGMNLMHKLDHFPMVYPSYEIDTAETKPLKTCVIADSYFWGLFDKGFSTRASDSGEFWYYFNDIYPAHFESNKSVQNVDLQKELKKFDVVILLATDGTLDRFAWGFLEHMNRIVSESH
ncbi:MAG: hypothetical protein H6608_06560 [Flavobacteriales bacterium]|nr:hypothetical protein [Flavobacteriales bacterium]